jgi:hypothetical protein
MPAVGLLSEAAPGAYDERGWHRSEAMPAIFHRLFGAHGIETDAAPGEIAFTIGGSRMKGAWIRDAIELAGAKRDWLLRRRESRGDLAPVRFWRGGLDRNLPLCCLRFESRLIHPRRHDVPFSLAAFRSCSLGEPVARLDAAPTCPAGWRRNGVRSQLERPAPGA